jgi:hypothetical protein
MDKKLRLQCWNCLEYYFETLEISERQIFIVKCPKCHKEAVLDIKPYRRRPPSTVVRNSPTESQVEEDEIQLPDIIPTNRRE